MRFDACPQLICEKDFINTYDFSLVTVLANKLIPFGLGSPFHWQICAMCAGCFGRHSFVSCSYRTKMLIP